MFDAIILTMAQTVGILGMLAGVAMVGATVGKALWAHIKGGQGA